MGFILDGLETESYERNYSDQDLLKRIMHYFKMHQKLMVLLIVTLVLNSVTGSVSPIIISKAIDFVAVKFEISIMLLFTAGIIIMGAAGWLFNYIRQKNSTRVIGEVVYKIRSEVFNKTIEHDMSFFDEQASGKLVSRITSDTHDFSQIIVLVVDFFSQFLLVLILTVWMVTISWKLTLIMISMVPFAFLIALSFRKIARRVTQDHKKMRATINSEIQESVSGIMVAKTFRQEKSLYENFLSSNQRAYQVGIRRGIILNSIFPIISLAAGLGTGLIMFFGGVAIKNSGLTIGQWYLFMQAVGFFWWPIINIASFWSQFQDGLSAAERVFSLMDLKPTVQQEDQILPDHIQGRISFENVNFAYNDKEVVLKDFSLLIQPGETVALVGHTGAGKSSIARLINRFYDFQGGRITIDDINIRNLNLNHFRKNIGLVPQDPFLFSGTVADNIRYSRPEATDREIIYAATHVGKGDWINDLPEGIETDVGHRGSKLSLGQRQLVALARVLLKDPAIFILDEATASVDPFTEVQIQQGLATVMESRTAIIIAHRLSTVQKSDRILVIEKGRIVEQGNHDELLVQNGHYATLYNTYFRHQSLEYIEQQF